MPEHEIRVVLSIDDPWHGVTGERVWATLVAADVAEIDNIPWFVEHVCLGDRVRVNGDGPVRDGREVVSRCGRSRFQVLLREGPASAPWMTYAHRLEASGATVIDASEKVDGYYVVEVPADVDVRLVRAVLDEAEDGEVAAVNDAYVFGPQDAIPRHDSPWARARGS